MDHTARENFTSNRSAVVLAVVGGVMVRFVDEVAPGTQKGIRKLRECQKRRRPRRGVTYRFVEVPGCSNVRGNDLRRDYPAGGFINARRSHLYGQQLQSHGPHASDELYTPGRV